MLVAEVLAAFALLCGLAAVVIVIYALWSDADSRLRQAQARLDFLGEGDGPLAFIEDSASLDAEIAEFERREERGSGPFDNCCPTCGEADPFQCECEIPLLSREEVERELGIAVDWTALSYDEHGRAVPGPGESRDVAFDRAVAVAEGYDHCECSACEAMLLNIEPVEPPSYFEPLASARVASLDEHGRASLRGLLADNDHRSNFEIALDWALDDGIRRAQLVALTATVDDTDDIPF